MCGVFLNGIMRTERKQERRCEAAILGLHIWRASPANSRIHAFIVASAAAAAL